MNAASQARIPAHFHSLRVLFAHVRKRRLRMATDQFPPWQVVFRPPVRSLGDGRFDGGWSGALTGVLGLLALGLLFLWVTWYQVGLFWPEARTAALISCPSVPFIHLLAFAWLVPVYVAAFWADTAAEAWLSRHPDHPFRLKEARELALREALDPASVRDEGFQELRRFFVAATAGDAGPAYRSVSAGAEGSFLEALRCLEWEFVATGSGFRSHPSFDEAYAECLRLLDQALRSLR